MSEQLAGLEAENKGRWSWVSIRHRALGDDMGGLIYGRGYFGAYFYFPYYYAFGGKLHVGEAMG